MASTEKEPPDVPQQKHYKCHPSVKVGAVVCIVCGSFIHTSEFIAKHNEGCISKILSSSFVICNDHPNLALSADVPYGDLNEQAWKLIALLKLEDRDQIKQEILREIAQDSEKIKTNSEVNFHETTLFEDYSENEALKIENKLLKELNQELKEKNNLLNELLYKEKQGNNNIIQAPRSYAEIVTNKPIHKVINKRVPKVIVKKIDSKDKTNLEKEVILQLTKDKTIQTKNIYSKNKDTIIINCMNIESVNSIEKSLKKELTKNFKVEKEQIKKPTVKVINIDAIFEDNLEIEKDINERNFRNFEDKCIIRHSYQNPKTKKISAIMEVTPKIYSHIKENKDKIFVGYQNCRVFDIINTNPCNSCSRFGHSAKKCENEVTCLKCAGKHKAEECTSTISKCPNCDFYNKKFNTGYNTDHSAIDSEKCQVLINKINKFIETTDYPIKPTYSRFFGKVDQVRLQRSTRTIRKQRNPSVGTLSTERERARALDIN